MKKILNAIKKFFSFIFRMIKGFFVGIVRFIVLVFRQMKKMRWPSKKLISSSTVVVLTFMVFMAVVLTVGDFVIINLLRLINY